MVRGLLDPITKPQHIWYWVRSKLCSQCKYSGHYGLFMCRRHSSKNWARWQATQELKESWEYKRKFILDHIKKGRGFIKPENFYLFPFLKFFDRLLIRWYQRKK